MRGGGCGTRRLGAERTTPPLRSGRFFTFVQNDKAARRLIQAPK